MESSKKLPLWLRWWGLINLAVTFVWLPIEDVQFRFITVLSVMWCAWIGGWLWIRFAKRWGTVYRGIAIGGVSGAMFFPAALALAVVKAGIHAHGFLDYSNFELGRLASFTPEMVLAGVILGLICSFLAKKWGKNGNPGQNV